jgi:hypothetical protein
MFEQAFKNIDDILFKEAGCTTELDYTEQTCWLLFLKYLDSLELDRAMVQVVHPIVAHRSPQDIMDEIAALDAEAAEVLTTIRELL